MMKSTFQEKYLYFNHKYYIKNIPANNSIGNESNLKIHN